MPNMTRPASYALALLHDIHPGPALHTYLGGIDATLAPHGGSFLIHGGTPRVVEGSLTCDLIVIGFPHADGAHHWYHSPAYQQLAELRRTFAQGAVVLYRGEDIDHRAFDILTSNLDTSTAEDRGVVD
ncbi:DUF1330 domain-containing protein [Rhodococcus sp. H29-C3]|uniref:DUF1330 domain-containing protein n=1 Tax=Rhodococcus sp. H29-C3 TaxID=3046307 RepID=UPI0024B8A7CA|nr:DUF1330 domain-containing protein [Rhodococcus sp. H29-C3]MDJ0362782.1 DUF1330 domain-containing protein [Rhodococcus sp. H29-C3]